MRLFEVIKGMDIPLTRRLALNRISFLGFKRNTSGKCLSHNSLSTEDRKAGFLNVRRIFFAPSGLISIRVTVKSFFANSRIPPSKPFIGLTSTPKYSSNLLYVFETFLLAIATSSPNTPYRCLGFILFRFIAMELRHDLSKLTSQMMSKHPLVDQPHSGPVSPMCSTLGQEQVSITYQDNLEY